MDNVFLFHMTYTSSAPLSFTIPYFWFKDDLAFQFYFYLVSQSTTTFALDWGAWRRPCSTRRSFPLSKHGHNKSSQT